MTRFLLSSQLGITGHQPFLQDAEAGELEHHYLTTYGSIVRWRGPLGVREILEPDAHPSPIADVDNKQEDRLWIADPKAISHILHSGDLWVRTPTNREMNAVLLDKGVVWAQGDDHKRQRKALTPAFGLSESKALMPRFLLVANKVRNCRRLPPSASSPNGSLRTLNYPISFRIQLVDKWKEVVESEASGGSSTLDIPTWMGKATLDA